MRIRGERECGDCGHRWSYYETGSVSCPACGSLRSTGIGERARHTADPVELDLTHPRELAGAGCWEEAIDEAVECCGEYVRRRGFIRGGELLAFDDTYLGATELRAACRTIERGFGAGVDDAEEIYLLSLLRGVDGGERPPIEDVPASESVRSARALAYAKAIREYRKEVNAYLDDYPDPAVAGVLGSIAEHVKRIQALDGNVDLQVIERLVNATKDVGRATRESDEGTIATAHDRLDRLSGI